jgi:hypothetical protein
MTIHLPAFDCYIPMSPFALAQSSFHFSVNAGGNPIAGPLWPNGMPRLPLYQQYNSVNSY